MVAEPDADLDLRALDREIQALRQRVEGLISGGERKLSPLDVREISSELDRLITWCLTRARRGAQAQST